MTSADRPTLAAPLGGDGARVLRIGADLRTVFGMPDPAPLAFADLLRQIDDADRAGPRRGSA